MVASEAQTIRLETAARRTSIPGRLRGRRSRPRRRHPGDFSIVEFSIELGLVPPHTHLSEDELSYVLDGEVSFRVGDETIDARPGTYVYKSRDVMHTFWNATQRSARILEIISPAGLEQSFRGEATPSNRKPNIYSDEWVPDLKQRYGLKLLGEP